MRDSDGIHCILQALGNKDAVRPALQKDIANNSNARDHAYTLHLVRVEIDATENMSVLEKGQDSSELRF